MAGTVQLSIPNAVLDAAPAGSVITIRHAETLWPNGSLHHLYGAKVRADACWRVLTVVLAVC